MEDLSVLKPLRIYSHDKRSGCAPFVTMVQATDLRERDNIAGGG